MSTRNLSDIPLGKTYFQGTTPDITSGSAIAAEGASRTFPNLDPDSTYPVQKLRDGSTIRAVMVRNGSGGTLVPGDAVTWLADYHGRRIGAKVTATQGRAAGIVDPYRTVSETIAANDLFWLIVEGDCECNLPTAGSSGGIAQGDLVVVDAEDGKVEKGTVDGTTYANDDQLLLNNIGYCKETISAAGTGRVLVHLKSLW